MRKVRLSILVCIAVLVCACGSKSVIYNPETQFTATDVSKVEAVIFQVCTKLGWKPNKIEDGIIEATLRQRAHTAVIHIIYTDKDYKIIYQSSDELDYSAKNNTIHPNYNRWIERLDRNLSQEIYRVATGVAVSTDSDSTVVEKIYQYNTINYEVEIDKVLAPIKEKYPQTIIIDLRDLICHENICSALIDGYPLYNDIYGHITPYASHHLGEMYLEKYGNPFKGTDK
jgi:hypothetical protein